MKSLSVIIFYPFLDHFLTQNPNNSFRRADSGSVYKIETKPDYGFKRVCEEREVFGH